jgi:hypothetical protein
MALTDRSQGVARGFLVANGLLLPFIALQMYWHGLIWIASLWAHPGATRSLAVVFRRAVVTTTDDRSLERAGDRAA